MKDDDRKLCDSRECWWPKIKDLAEKFEKALNDKWNKSSVFFQLDTEKLNSALEMYERGWWTFKEHVYGEAAKEERIDRHKIISLYILSFLIKRPFRVRANPETKDANRHLFLANELFSLVVMRDLISVWNDKSKPFNMSENEKIWFVILLNFFKLKFIRLNPAKISDDPSSVTDLLSLSQIVYYVEKPYILP